MKIRRKSKAPTLPKKELAALRKQLDATAQELGRAPVDMTGVGTGGARGGRKVGRNAPCPCGSGKKYKKCCLRSGKYEG